MSTRGQEVWKGHVSTFYCTTRRLNVAQGAYKYEIFLSDFSVINSLTEKLFWHRLLESEYSFSCDLTSHTFPLRDFTALVLLYFLFSSSPL